MNTELKPPKKQYPYLAVWVGADGIVDVKNIMLSEILVISLIRDNDNKRQIYVQSLLGSYEGYVTAEENEYAALPMGYKIEITQ